MRGVFSIGYHFCLGFANLSSPKGIMFRGYNRPIATFRSVIRSRILAAGVLCLFFLALSIRVTPESCYAFEKGKPHKNHITIVPEINWNYSSVPRIPHENQCSCSFPRRSCCMGPINSTPKDSHNSLFFSDTFRRLSVLQTLMIRPPNRKPLIQQNRCFHNFNSSVQKEVFLVNCALLI